MNLRSRLSLLHLSISLSGECKPVNPSFFILSSGRSGSTLLRKILMKGDQVYIPPESNDWIAQLLNTVTKPLFLTWNRRVDRAINILRSDADFRHWPVSIDLLQKRLTELPNAEQNARSLISILYKSAAEAEGKQSLLIGDKTPYVTQILPWVNAFNPKARYIFLYRHPGAVVHSRMKNFGETVEVATERWISAIRNTRKMKWKADKILWVKYEDLVSQPIKEVSRICSFLSIEFNEAMLEGAEFDMGDTQLAHHKKTQRPITATYADKWKDEISIEVKEYVDSKTSELATDFGY